MGMARREARFGRSLTLPRRRTSPQPYLLGNLARISFTASLAKAWSLSPDCLRSTLVFAQPRQRSTFFLGSMKSIIRVPLDACPG